MDNTCLELYVSVPRCPSYTSVSPLLPATISRRCPTNVLQKVSNIGANVALCTAHPTLPRQTPLHLTRPFGAVAFASRGAPEFVWLTNPKTPSAIPRAPAEPSKISPGSVPAKACRTCTPADTHCLPLVSKRQTDTSIHERKQPQQSFNITNKSPVRAHWQAYARFAYSQPGARAACSACAGTPAAQPQRTNPQAISVALTGASFPRKTTAHATPAQAGFPNFPVTTMLPQIMTGHGSAMQRQGLLD